jgi:hypothetical protein
MTQTQSCNISYCQHTVRQWGDGRGKKEGKELVGKSRNWVMQSEEEAFITLQSIGTQLP